jgi:hypothetical protein
MHTTRTLERFAISLTVAGTFLLFPSSLKNLLGLVGDGERDAHAVAVARVRGLEVHGSYLVLGEQLARIEEIGLVLGGHLVDGRLAELLDVIEERVCFVALPHELDHVADAVDAKGNDQLRRHVGAIDLGEHHLAADARRLGFVEWKTHGLGEIELGHDRGHGWPSL